MRHFAPCFSSATAGISSQRCKPRRPALLVNFARLAFLLVLFALAAGPVQAAQISEYGALQRPVRDRAGKAWVAIRSFKRDGVAHFLVIDPATLASADLPAASLEFAGAPAAAALSSTLYLKALNRYSSAPYRLQNAGITRAEHAADGVFLTVDLCPSKRAFERELFQAAEALGQGAPVPVAVCVSGLWLLNHPEELSYLKAESAAGRLAITWVNHSYHHVYDSRAPLERNFLLTPGTDFSSEVLDLEQLLLARDLVPSPFFRFPGLVSDRATVTRLRELSLIPIGSDAWLAKGESPRPGSFILVHGNGNEPKGIRLLLPMLKGQELRLLPLAAAFGK
jgi:hypothetical protein